MANGNYYIAANGICTGGKALSVYQCNDRRLIIVPIKI
jgi:hypothetical protein